MTLKIGDFVMQDGHITEIERTRDSMLRAPFSGTALSKSLEGCFFNERWNIAANARIINIKDLERLATYYPFNTRDYTNIEDVRQFIKRATLFVLLNNSL